MAWHPSSWRQRPIAQGVAYPDARRLARIARALALSPPLVSAADCRRLRTDMARVATGEAMLLQGGDCAERIGAPAAETSATLALLESLGGQLAAATGQEIVQVARIAGQFAKPRSAETETRGGATLPAWRGGSVNRPAFSAAARRPDPALMLAAYRDAAATLELMRHVSPDTFSSHEALLLDYEEALSRTEDGRHWCLSAHMIWLGERTRQLDGAHVEYGRGVANVVGVKCGPGLNPDTLLRLLDRLDPDNEPGRLVLIARMGAGRVATALPPLMGATRAQGRAVAWVCDPMHGNTRQVAGTKRRALSEIVGEVRGFITAAAASGVRPAGLHIEMTGAAILECDRGVAGDGLDAAHFPLCDPRLNAAQAAEVVGTFADAIARDRAA